MQRSPAPRRCGRRPKSPTARTPPAEEGGHPLGKRGFRAASSRRSGNAMLRLARLRRWLFERAPSWAIPNLQPSSPDRQATQPRMVQPGKRRRTEARSNVCRVSDPIRSSRPPFARTSAQRSLASAASASAASPPDVRRSTSATPDRGDAATVPPASGAEGSEPQGLPRWRESVQARNGRAAAGGVASVRLCY
jgi:hypothetical protein